MTEFVHKDAGDRRSATNPHEFPASHKRTLLREFGTCACSEKQNTRHQRMASGVSKKWLPEQGLNLRPSD